MDLPLLIDNLYNPVLTLGCNTTQFVKHHILYDLKKNENMFITTDIYSISETNARHKYIGKSIKQ